MTKSRSGVRLGSQRPRWQKLPVGLVSSAGDDAIEIASQVGLDLFDWQKWWLLYALAEGADGDWCSKETVLITGRQSGKNGVLAALELAALFVFKDPLTIHSAHEVPTSLKHFNYMLELIDRSPDLRKKCLRPCRTNGREAIKLRSGPMLEFRARGTNQARGLTAGRLVLDEAFKLSAAAMGSLLPTMRAMRNTQVTYASSAPKADSMMLHTLIARGDANDPADRLFYANWGNPIGTKMDDVDGWYQANPSLGLMIPESNLQDEYRTLVSGGNAELIAEFAREAVGIGEVPTTEAANPAIPPAQWELKVCKKLDPEPTRITIGIAVSHGGDVSSVSIGTAHPDGGEYVETIRNLAGSAWVPPFIVGLVQRRSPEKIGLDASGPSGAIVPDLKAAFVRAELDYDELVHNVSARDFTGACGSFVADLPWHPESPSEGLNALDLAVSKATWRLIGDAKAFKRQDQAVPIAALESAAIARAMWLTVPEDSVAGDDFMAYLKAQQQAPSPA